MLIMRLIRLGKPLITGGLTPNEIINFSSSLSKSFNRMFLSYFYSIRD